MSEHEINKPWSPEPELVTYRETITGGFVASWPINVIDAAEIPAENWPRPIPVSERLPEHCGGVLAYFTNRDRWQLAFLMNGKLVDSDVLDDTASHWLPLPPAPK